MEIPNTSLNESSPRLSRIPSSKTFCRFVVFSISELSPKLGNFPLSFSRGPVGPPSLLFGLFRVSNLLEGPDPPAFPTRLSYTKTLEVWHAASTKPVFSSTGSLNPVTSQTRFSASSFFNFFLKKHSRITVQNPMLVPESMFFFFDYDDAHQCQVMDGFDVSFRRLFRYPLHPVTSSVHLEGPPRFTPVYMVIP